LCALCVQLNDVDDVVTVTFVVIFLGLCTISVVFGAVV